MSLRKIRIELEAAEIQQLSGIALDDVNRQAMAFIKRTLDKRIKKALQSH